MRHDATNVRLVVAQRALHEREFLIHLPMDPLSWPFSLRTRQGAAGVRHSSRADTGSDAVKL
jgi:polysaccharide deacetylase 2 family uncharacterized protein YibQ